MFDDDKDGIFEEDLLADRNIDNDNQIDGLDLGSRNTNAQSSEGWSTNGTGCLIFILALPIAIMLMMLIFQSR